MSSASLLGLCFLAAFPGQESGVHGIAELNRVGGRQPQRQVETPLMPLMVHCQKMLDAQTAVLSWSKRLDNVMRANVTGNATPAQLQASLSLAERQRVIIAEATQVIKLLRADGTAVAFPEVFDQLREDMTRVLFLLEDGNVGPGTQDLQLDIIDTLKDMVRAMGRRC